MARGSFLASTMVGWDRARLCSESCLDVLPSWRHPAETCRIRLPCSRAVTSVSFISHQPSASFSVSARVLSPVSNRGTSYMSWVSTFSASPYTFGSETVSQPGKKMKVFLHSLIIIPACFSRAWHPVAGQPLFAGKDSGIATQPRNVGPIRKINPLASPDKEDGSVRRRGKKLASPQVVYSFTNPILRRAAGLKENPVCVATRTRDFSTYWKGCSAMTEAKAHATVKSAIDMLSRDLEEEVENKRQRLKTLRQQHGNDKLGNVTYQHVIGGMRGLTALLTETSSLDPHKGITYRGYTIEELIEKLPRFGDEEYPPVEGVIWVLLTGKIPSAEQTQLLSAALHALSCSSPPPSPETSKASSASSDAHTVASSHFIPHHTHETLEALPTTTHPMTQLVVSVASLQPSARLAAAYQQGTRKELLWQSALYDALSVIAKTAVLAARIYQRTFRPHNEVPVPRHGLDWGANFAAMLGLKSDDSYELIRLYLLLHADHEGGNVSAHAAHVVGSALSDVYLAAAAGLAGLAGPLHGLANQESLKWLQNAADDLGGEKPTPEAVKQLAQKTLNSGRVIPGYGHAVLRVTDPRFLVQRTFALKYLKDDKLFKLLDVAHKVIPEVLLATGKVQNPYPNVDCHSGVLLHHYNLRESNYYTVLFGVARVIGIASQHVLSRGLLLPIERPKSITVEQLEERAGVAAPVPA